jgi:hypothetical protein
MNSVPDGDVGLALAYRNFDVGHGHVVALGPCMFARRPERVLEQLCAPGSSCSSVPFRDRPRAKCVEKESILDQKKKNLVGGKRHNEINNMMDSHSHTVFMHPASGQHL